MTVIKGGRHVWPDCAYYIGDDSCEEKGLFLLVRGFLLGGMS